jgi:hypothetical protein
VAWRSPEAVTVGSQIGSQVSIPSTGVRMKEIGIDYISSDGIPIPSSETCEPRKPQIREAAEDFTTEHGELGAMSTSPRRCQLPAHGRLIASVRAGRP